jgi:hypothetical protein
LKFSPGALLDGAGVAQASTVVDVLQDVATSYNVFLSGNMGGTATPYTSGIEGHAAIEENATF